MLECKGECNVSAASGTQGLYGSYAETLEVLIGIQKQTKMEIQKETQAKIQALNASNDEYLLAEEDKIRDIFEAKSDAIREATRRKVTLRREENSQEMSERCQEKEAAIQREAEDSKDKARKEMEKEVRSQVQKLEEKQNLELRTAKVESDAFFHISLALKLGSVAMRSHVDAGNDGNEPLVGSGEGREGTRKIALTRGIWGLQLSHLADRNLESNAKQIRDSHPIPTPNELRPGIEESFRGVGFAAVRHQIKAKMERELAEVRKDAIDLVEHATGGFQRETEAEMETVLAGLRSEADSEGREHRERAWRHVCQETESYQFAVGQAQRELDDEIEAAKPLLQGSFQVLRSLQNLTKSRLKEAAAELVNAWRWNTPATEPPSPTPELPVLDRPMKSEEDGGEELVSPPSVLVVCSKNAPLREKQTVREIVKALRRSGSVANGQIWLDSERHGEFHGDRRSASMSAAKMRLAAECDAAIYVGSESSTQDEECKLMSRILESRASTPASGPSRPPSAIVSIRMDASSTSLEGSISMSAARGSESSSGGADDDSGMLDRVDYVTKGLSRHMPRSRPGVRRPKKKDPPLDAISSMRLLEMSEEQVSLWLRKSLTLAPRLKDQVLNALAEFMPDGQMLAALTDQQLVREVELDNALLRAKLLKAVDTKLRLDGDFHSMRENTGQGAQPGCIFLSFDPMFDEAPARRMANDLQARGTNPLSLTLTPYL